MKSNRTRARTALAKEEGEANTLLQRDLNLELSNEREVERYLLSISKVILNLETKLARLEAANEKLADAIEQSEDTSLTEEFQVTLDEDGEFTDGIIDKISQLRVLKEDVDRKRRSTQSRQSQKFEERLQQVQEQVKLLQSPSRSISRIWSQPSMGAIKPPQLDIAPFKGEVLKWQEFWDAFEASVDKADYAPVDKFNYLKSKLRGDALEAISGYQLSNDNYKVVVDVLKRRFGKPQLIIDAHYHSLSQLPPATNHVTKLRHCYDTIECHLRSLEAIGENIDHRHFVSLILEKLPQKVRYQLHIQKPEDEEWTVAKLRLLLGRHISAMEMAGSESFEVPTNSNPNHGGQRNKYSQLKSTTEGLLAGNSHSKNQTSQKVSQPRQPRCIYCNEPHWSDECPRYTTLQTRKEKLKGCCFNCLKSGHVLKECKVDRACAHCGKKGNHHRSLCSTLFQQTPSPQNISVESVKPEGAMVANTNQVLMQTANAIVKNTQDGSSLSVRLILDSGSQRSYVTESLAKGLKMAMHPTEKLTVVTFGSNRPKSIDCKQGSLNLLLKDGSVMPINVTVVPNITGKINRVPLKQEDLEFLKNEFVEGKLADSLPYHSESSTIEMLIGNDYYFDLLEPRKMELGGGVFLFHSKLGWILGGRVEHVIGTNDESSLLVSTIGSAPNGIKPDTHMLTSIDPSLDSKPSLEHFWNLESIGITDSPTTCNDELALENFTKTVKFTDGRYMVTWPWRESAPDLPQNYQLAIGRLRSTVQRLMRTPELFKQYDQIIQEQLSRGIIEKVTSTSTEGSIKHYIPHHPVITPSKSTTKVRIVYDASAKTRKTNKSLNECLYRGPVIMPSLYGLLIRFRLSPIGVVGDIEKAFLNVGLQAKERDVTRFLWLQDSTIRNVENNLQIYRFCRIPFGIISSPFLLAATINYHLQESDSPVAKKLQGDIYVDNVITGVSTLSDAKDLYLEAKSLFAAASMNLREWASNSKEFMDFISQKDQAGKFGHKVLGINWDLINDTLSVPGPSVGNVDYIWTKRAVLQVISSVFDPLGYFSPTVLKAKLFMKNLWIEKCEWDTKLNEKQLEIWLQIIEALKEIPLCNLPRYIGITQEKTDLIQYNLICFCDASAKAFATVIYLHQSFSNSCKVDLIFSKTKLAPLNMTIPRLELMGILIGVRALKFVSSELHLQIKGMTVFTDSMCVLHWIQSKKSLSVFVTNRLKEIKSLKGVTFKHVSSEDNPADLATRGKPPRELSSSIWWMGPTWLKYPEQQWPVFKIPPESRTSEVDSEMKGNKVMFEANLLSREDLSRENLQLPDLSDIDECRYSSLLKLSRVTAWVLRFVTKLKKGESYSGPLTVKELQKARLAWDLYIQSKCYPDLIRGNKGNLRNQLNLQQDDYGLLRCHGRYGNATSLSQATKYPKLLPKDEHYTTLIVEDCHKRVFHAGVSQTLAQIRLEYWIPHGRSTVRKLLKQCRICRRCEGSAFKLPNMPPWPKERVVEALPFEYTGLDYFGPLHVKLYTDTDKPTYKKVWVCLFTCMVVRAIHLELVDDMSADEFLLCLRRFMARRGIPRQIISDNAKQFKATKEMLNEAKFQASDCIDDYLSKQGIHWRFIVQLAPWMGGFYERLVGLTKRALRKSLGSQCLTEKQLATVLTEIEAVVNSRPLVYVDDDINSSMILTPSDFLSFHSHHTFPNVVNEPDPEFKLTRKLTSSQVLLQTWKRGQNRLNQFWSLWRNEYLLSLREKSPALSKGSKNIPGTPKIGDVVLVKDNLPRGRWRVGRISEVIKGKDQKIRSAKVTVAPNKYLHRAVSMLYPIECPDEVTNDTDMRNQIPDTTLRNADKEDDLEDNEDDDSYAARTNQPTRNVAIAARKKLKLWLDPDDDDVLLGSVADHASNQ